MKGYEIIQKPGRFCFGMDAVLLSSYAKVKRGERALDLGTGTGILPILLEAKKSGTSLYRSGSSGRKVLIWQEEAWHTTGWRTR